MRKLLLYMLLLPIQLLGQNAICYVDTVTVAGYFYQFMGHGWRVKKWEGIYADDAYFVSDKMLAGRTVEQYMREASKEEIDREKFLAQLPFFESRPFKHADSATLMRLNQVIEVRPFTLGKRAKRFGVTRDEAVVTRVNARWMRLVVDSGYENGFNNPPSIDGRYVRAVKKVYVYLPLEILSMEKHIRLRRRKSIGAIK